MLIIEKWCVAQDTYKLSKVWKLYTDEQDTISMAWKIPTDGAWNNYPQEAVRV